VESVSAGPGHDLREAGCASANLRGHPARTRPNLSTASTLKLENVEPPISGSLMSAPSIANTASTPHWPLMANRCVKFVAPFASVILPAVNNSSWLESGLLSVSTLTVWLDSASRQWPHGGPSPKLQRDLSGRKRNDNGRRSSLYVAGIALPG